MFWLVLFVPFLVLLLSIESVPEYYDVNERVIELPNVVLDWLLNSGFEDLISYSEAYGEPIVRVPTYIYMMVLAFTILTGILFAKSMIIHIIKSVKSNAI